MKAVAVKACDPFAPRRNAHRGLRRIVRRRYLLPAGNPGGGGGESSGNHPRM